MNYLIRPVLHVIMVTLMISFAAMITKAQDPKCKTLDPVCVDPASYKVLYEDSNVRVLRYDDIPGHVVHKHTHQYPYRVYVITTATREFISLDEKTNECQKIGAEVKLFANDELMRPPTTHCEVNNGQAPTHLIIFEFKNQKATTTVALGRRRRPNISFNPTPR
jgi:hypothetical protein